jgi:alpha-glucosidase
VRYLRDGEPRTVEATATAGQDGEVWWRADIPLRNPVTSYRWFLSGGSTGYAWLNGSGLHAHEVPAASDFRILAEPGGPDWHASSVVYEIFLDRFATSGTPRPSPLWAVPREWGRLPEARTRNTNRELYGGDLAGIETHLDHVESLGANVLYLTPFFPAESNHRYDPLSFDRVDPVLGGDDALVSLAAAARARGLRLIGDVSLDRSGAEHEWFRRAQADPTSTERSLFMFERSESEAYVRWLGTARYPRFDWRSRELRTRMSGVLQRWLAAGLDGWRVGAANMVGRYRDADLNAEIARWAREQVRDGLLIAEYSHDFEQDVDGLGWHGVMNYAGFLRPVWWWLRSGTGESTAFDVFLSTPAPAYAEPRRPPCSTRSASRCPGTSSCSRGCRSTHMTRRASAPSSARANDTWSASVFR